MKFEYMEETLQEKILRVHESKGLSFVDIARLLKVPKDNLYKWKDGGKCSDGATYIKVIAGLETLLNTHVMPDSSKKEQKKAWKDKELFSDPLFVIDLFSGKVTKIYTYESWTPGEVVAVNDTMTLICCTHSRTPFLKAKTFVPVNSPNMEPTFRQGGWIGLGDKLQVPELVIPGRPYLTVDKNQGAVFSKLYTADKEGILLVSENEALYPPFRRTPDEIIAIFPVVVHVASL